MEALKSSNRIALLIFLLLFVCNKVHSQVELVVNEIEIYGIITTSNTGEYTVDGDDSGPYIKVFCEIYNNTDKTIKLDIHDLDSYSVSIAYIYKAHRYDVKAFSSPFGGYSSIDDMLWSGDKVEIVIKPHKSYKFDFGVNYLIGIIIDSGKSMPMIDCVEEIIETLPTLKVIYKDNSGLNLVSKEIKNVTVRDFLYITDDHYNKE